MSFLDNIFQEADGKAEKITKPVVFLATLIAPCGMNCHLCRSHLRTQEACAGCRGDDDFKSKSCLTCPIKNCEKRKTGEMEYCFGCEGYPCGQLSHLDNRYRSKYGMSMIENLNDIQRLGIRHFLLREKERWTCPECGDILCVHKPECSSCRYRWR